MMEIFDKLGVEMGRGIMDLLLPTLHVELIICLFLFW